ncbi:unnamed protein product, partial [Adineta ricciae]
MSRLTKVSLSSQTTSPPVAPTKRSQSSTSLISLMRLKNQSRRSNTSLSEKNSSSRINVSK